MKCFLKGLSEFFVSFCEFVKQWDPMNSRDSGGIFVQNRVKLCHRFVCGNKIFRALHVGFLISRGSDVGKSLQPLMRSRDDLDGH